jgi:hypothetical protein
VYCSTRSHGHFHRINTSLRNRRIINSIQRKHFIFPGKRQLRIITIMRSAVFARSLQKVLYTRLVASHSGFSIARSWCPRPSIPLTISPSVWPPRRLSAAIQTRSLSTEDQLATRPLTDRSQTDKVDKDKLDAETIAARKAAAPAYQLWITCKKCLERSSHTISKQAYHFGSCVVQCPKCKSQHLISDNLKVSVISKRRLLARLSC